MPEEIKARLVEFLRLVGEAEAEARALLWKVPREEGHVRFLLRESVVELTNVRTYLSDFAR